MRHLRTPLKWQQNDPTTGATRRFVTLPCHLPPTPSMATRLGVAAALLAAAAAQDPAQGWLGYAKGVSPTGTGILTRAEAKYVHTIDNWTLVYVCVHL